MLHGAENAAAKLAGVWRSGYSLVLWHTPPLGVQVRQMTFLCRSSPVGKRICACSTTSSSPVYGSTSEASSICGRSGSKSMFPEL
jgi:hypothetical protein